MKDKRVTNNRPESLRLESLCEHDMNYQTLHCVTIDCNLYVPISKIDRVPFVAERDAMIKRCPACHVPIERDQGCAQMSCKRCRHLFCWFCMKSLDVSYTRFYQIFVEFIKVWNLNSERPSSASLRSRTVQGSVGSLKTGYLLAPTSGERHAFASEF